jgi:hypothetical protein
MRAAHDPAVASWNVRAMNASQTVNARLIGRPWDAQDRRVS